MPAARAPPRVDARVAGGCSYDSFNGSLLKVGLWSVDNTVRFERSVRAILSSVCRLGVLQVPTWCLNVAKRVAKQCYL